MKNPELTNYIKVSLSKNISKETIKSELLKVGWGTDLVESAFDEINDASYGVVSKESKVDNVNVNTVEGDSNSWLKPVGDKKYRINFLIYVAIFIFVIQLFKSEFFEKIYLDQNIQFIAVFILAILAVGFYFLYILAGRLKYMNYSPYFVFISFIPGMGPLLGLLATFLLLANYETVGNKKVENTNNVVSKPVDIHYSDKHFDKNETKSKDSNISHLVKAYMFNLVGLGSCFVVAVSNLLLVIPAIIYILATFYAFKALIFINFKNKKTGKKADIVTRIVVIILSLVSLYWTFLSVMLLLLASSY